MKLHTPAELSAKSGTLYKNPTNLLDRNKQVKTQLAIPITFPSICLVEKNTQQISNCKGQMFQTVNVPYV